MSSEENRIKILPRREKRVWKIDSIYFVSIDKSIVNKLGISEQNTLLEQEITKEGILMKVRKI